MKRSNGMDIIGVERVIMPENINGDSIVEFKDQYDVIKIYFRFILDDENQKSRMNIVGKEDHVDLTFVNFAKATAQATQAPVKIGESDDKHSLFLMAVVWKVGTVKVVEIQLMVER